MYRLSRCVPLAHEDKTFQDAHQHADITNPKKPIMKFMITWQFHQGKLHEGYSQFFKMTLSLLTKVSRAKNPFVETFFPLRHGKDASASPIGTSQNWQ
jgi:hypothetical protein